MKKHLDKVGLRFGSLTVLERLPKASKKYKQIRFLCICDCGNNEILKASTVISSVVKDCKSCRSKRLAKKSDKYHGYSKTVEYRSWAGMKSRCNNVKCPEYKNYGGRGIKVCEEWNNDFISFLTYMGLKPAKNYSIDRIDVNGNYEPGNCKWSDEMEQGNNRRNTVLITAFGQTKTAREWHKEKGTPCANILSRNRNGKKDHELFAPIEKRIKRNNRPQQTKKV